MAKRGRPAHPDILTPREWEVLDLVREGLSNEAIAERLGISVSGVKFHVTEILGKLGLDNRTDLARWQPAEARPWWAAAPLALWRRLGSGWVAGAVAGGLALVVVASVASLVWALVQSRDDMPSAQDTESLAGLQICRAENLEAQAGYQGATMSMLGGVRFTNTRDMPCYLRGWAEIALTDGSGEDLDITYRRVRSEQEPEVVVLEAQEVGSVMFYWSNWCPPGARSMSGGWVIDGGVIVVVTLPSGEQISARANRERGPTPTCISPEEGSSATTGAFTKDP